MEPIQEIVIDGDIYCDSPPTGVDNVFSQQIQPSLATLLPTTQYLLAETEKNLASLVSLIANGDTIDKHITHQQHPLLFELKPAILQIVKHIGQSSPLLGNIESKENTASPIISSNGSKYPKKTTMSPSLYTAVTNTVFTTVSSICEPITMDDPLIVMLGIGEYDGLPNLAGVVKDYGNILKTFINKWMYKVFYRLNNNRDIYTNNVFEFKRNSNYKLKWTIEEIEDFVEQARKYIVKNKHNGLIFAISSHGNTGKVLYVSDLDEVELDECVFSMFTPETRIELESYTETEEEASHLLRIPKIFLLDMCRGDWRATVTNIDEKTAVNKDICTDADNTDTKTNNHDQSTSKSGLVSKQQTLQSGQQKEEAKMNGCTDSNATDQVKVAENADQIAIVPQSSQQQEQQQNVRSPVESLHITETTGDGGGIQKQNSKDSDNTTSYTETPLAMSEKFMFKGVSKEEANKLVAQMANFCKLYANVDGYTVADGSENGGLFLRNICKVFNDRKFVNENLWSDMIIKIREYTKRAATLVGIINFTQIVEDEGTLERPIRFGSRYLKNTHQNHSHKYSYLYHNNNNNNNNNTINSEMKPTILENDVGGIAHGYSFEMDRMNTMTSDITEIKETDVEETQNTRNTSNTPNAGRLASVGTSHLYSPRTVDHDHDHDMDEHDNLNINDLSKTLSVDSELAIQLKHILEAKRMSGNNNNIYSYHQNHNHNHNTYVSNRMHHNVKNPNNAAITLTTPKCDLLHQFSVESTNMDDIQVNFKAASPTQLTPRSNYNSNSDILSPTYDNNNKGYRFRTRTRSFTVGRSNKLKTASMAKSKDNLRNNAYETTRSAGNFQVRVKINTNVKNKCTVEPDLDNEFPPLTTSENDLIDNVADPDYRDYNVGIAVAQPLEVREYKNSNINVGSGSNNNIGSNNNKIPKFGTAVNANGQTRDGDGDGDRYQSPSPSRSPARYGSQSPSVSRSMATIGHGKQVADIVCVIDPEESLVNNGNNNKNEYVITPMTTSTPLTGKALHERFESGIKMIDVTVLQNGDDGVKAHFENENDNENGDVLVVTLNPLGGSGGVNFNKNNKLNVNSRRGIHYTHRNSYGRIHSDYKKISSLKSRSLISKRMKFTKDNDYNNVNYNNNLNLRIANWKHSDICIWLQRVVFKDHEISMEKISAMLLKAVFNYTSDDILVVLDKTLLETHGIHKLNQA